MLTLHGFSPAFGLPDVSPFVIKAQLLLKLSGLPFEMRYSGLKGAPNGKLPWLEDGAAIIADSTRIRWHLEQQHGVDFSGGYDANALAVAWAVEKMLEDHCYWLGVYARWADDSNFSSSTVKLFRKVPLPMRALVSWMVRRRFNAALHAQGTSRLSDADRARLAQELMRSVAVILGDKPYLLGDTPCGADATVFAFIATALSPNFTSSLREAAQAQPNLVAYVARLRETYFA
jgi:glutathione S-transferase